jgi:hypothetical protein
MSFLQSLRCKRNRHEWGDWVTTETGEQECAQQRECTHCGIQETRRQSHAWGKWKYVALPSQKISHTTPCVERMEGRRRQM